MLLLLAPAVVLFLIFQWVSYLHPHRWEWRASLMMTALAWASLAVVLTEVLNLNARLDSQGLALAWGLVLLALLGVLARLLHGARPGLSRLIPARKEVLKWMQKQDRGTWVMLAVLGIQVIVLGIVAMAYAPNTLESMTYQLSRVMHWLQNHSLASFATSNVREAYFPPFSEYVFLHQMALAGGDRYVNLVQWIAFLVSLVGVSAIAAEFGARPGTQIAAALLSAGVPMAVLQATTARNDLLLAVWLVTLTWFGLRWIRQPDSWVWAAGTGLSLGLALLTKATGFIFALPLGILIAAFVIRNGGLRPGLVRGSLVLLLGLALNLGHLSRNWILYGNPIGAQQRVGNDFMSPAVFASNTLRNVAVNVPANCAPPLSILNQPGRWFSAGLGWLHSLTGLSPTDPRTTWGFVDVFEQPMGCRYDEHFSGYPLHGLLVFGACLALPFLRPVDPLARWFGLALVADFVLLNLVLRWQVWGTHLQLPLFVLWAPLVALVLSQVRGPDLAGILAILAVALSFVWIYNNDLRPLSGLIAGSAPSRDEQYFQSMERLYPDYDAMTELVARSGCERVGLRISSLVLEYPLWVLLQEKGFEGEIQHLDVPNETKVLEDPAFVPCAVISEGYSPDHAGVLAEHEFGLFRLYLDEAGVQ